MTTGGDGSLTRPLELTPTYTVAAVCTFYVVSSLFAERGLHYLSKWLSKNKRKSLNEALDKIKEELMLLGFISLLLAVTADYISTFCVKSSFYETQPTPCRVGGHHGLSSPSQSTGDHKMKGATEAGPLPSTRHLLSSPVPISKTCPVGQEPFITFHGLEQLHRFIFVMAITHILYSCMAILLSLVKVHRWSVWEEEAHNNTHDTIAELTSTISLKRQSTIVSDENSKARITDIIVICVVCFFRQFGQGVTKSDYLSLRMGFIARHHTSASYNFHSYMVRSMEDEFQEIVGVSFSLWIFVVAFMLFNVDGLHLYFWISFIPIIMILLVGVKLQYIIATLVIENAGVRAQTVRPRDELFWFKKPELLLTLIHFVSFQNAFEMATFIWAVWQFGVRSCFFEHPTFVYIRLISGILVQVFCSYSTLPVYALATQMGSNFKKAIFPDSIVQSLHGWHKEAKKKIKCGVVRNEESSNKGLENGASNGGHKIDMPTTAESRAEIGRSPVQKSTPHLRTVAASPRESIVSGGTG